jgi:hypothetical protein
MPTDGNAHKSGRLRLKKSRKERGDDYREHKDGAERRRSKHRERKRRREEDSADEIKASGASGPSRHPTALFGDDLLRAERYEARLQEEKNWSAKLGELLQDDLQGGFTEYGSGTRVGGGGDDAAWEEEMMRLRGDQFDGQVQQEIPKRWKDAAQGFESKIGRGTAGLKEMDEEEYAEYIRDGVWRRTHAKEIAFEEQRQKAWEDAQERKRKAREEKKAALKQRLEADERESSKRTLDLARTEWERKWSEMVSQPGDEQSHFFSDIPLPILPNSGISKESIRFFIFHESEKKEASKRMRTALLRYHPDRFLSSRHFAKMQDEKEQARAREAVEKVAKILSEIVNDRRDQESGI